MKLHLRSSKSLSWSKIPVPVMVPVSGYTRLENMIGKRQFETPNKNYRLKYVLKK
jgi:hypothetical protein